MAWEMPPKWNGYPTKCKYREMHEWMNEYIKPVEPFPGVLNDYH